MKIAILGFGTVGSGAYEAAKSAPGIEVKRIVDLRDFPDYRDILTKDINDVLDDDEIELVAECMGGVHPAYEFVTGAMRRGKHVVTPNKNLVSACYDELMACAAENGVEFRFTPAAGGGIPWLYNLMRSRRCDEILEVHGIVNGTCNYILDNMHTNGADFAAVLAEAQALGYAERDPSADIDGHDTLRKCVISSNIAFDARLREEDIPTFGIRSITAEDVAWCNANGYTCKLLMNAGLAGDALYAYVEPELFTADALESGVKANFNLITLTGVNVGPLSFYGQGAGMMPTGTSLVQDMIDIAAGIGFAPADGGTAHTLDNTKVAHRYYFRGSDLSGLPASVIAEQFARGSDTVVLTAPISVTAAHQFAADCAARGIDFFMAGINE
ncbi:MAG: homoserine dehydrogenase [Mogibacterium sp.]|nr:homoserine dehydrogenase [Mogibacterium sp.]